MADLSKLRAGTSHLTSGGGKRFTPFIYWKEDKEAKHLAFLSSIEEIVKLQLHTFVKTPGGYRNFVCRKDPVFAEESNNTCILCDKFGHKVVTRHMATAVELEPVSSRQGTRVVISGYEVKQEEFETKEGEKKTAAKVGFVVQGFNNFFNYLSIFAARKGDITEHVFEVVRSGKNTKTAYTFFEDDKRPDLSEVEVPDMFGWIEEHGSEAYYAEELAGYVGEDGEQGDSSEAPASDASSDREGRFQALMSELDNASPAPTT